MSTSNKTAFVANAISSWGEGDIPEWVVVLAQEAERSSATAIAQRIGYSVAVVSAVIRANYAGDLSKVEAKVRVSAVVRRMPRRNRRRDRLRACDIRMG